MTTSFRHSRIAATTRQRRNNRVTGQGRRDVSRNPVSPEEVAALLTAANGDPTTRDVRDVITTVVNTGLRSNELRDLRWADIDLKERRLFVNTWKTRTMRMVPFGPSILKLLQGRRKRDPHSDYVLGEGSLLAESSTALHINSGNFRCVFA